MLRWISESTYSSVQISVNNLRPIYNHIRSIWITKFAPYKFGINDLVSWTIRFISFSKCFHNKWGINAVPLYLAPHMFGPVSLQQHGYKFHIFPWRQCRPSKQVSTPLEISTSYHSEERFSYNNRHMLIIISQIHKLRYAQEATYYGYLDNIYRDTCYLFSVKAIFPGHAPWHRAGTTNTIYLLVSLSGSFLLIRIFPGDMLNSLHKSSKLTYH